MSAAQSRSSSHSGQLRVAVRPGQNAAQSIGWRACARRLIVPPLRPVPYKGLAGSSIHTVASVLTLLLVALLENAGRRSAEAAQEKLNVIAEALAALMASRALEDDTVEEAATRLREAVGLEERD